MNALAHIEATTDAKRKRGEQILSATRDLVVNDEEDAEQLAAIADVAHKEASQLQAEADVICKPLRQHERAIAARFRAAKRPFEEIKKRALAAIDAYRLRVAEAALPALETATTTTEFIEASKAIAVKVAGTKQRKTWSAVVVDESKLPRQYWTIDQAALNRKAREEKERFSVPGCEVRCESKSGVR